MVTIERLPGNEATEEPDPKDYSPDLLVDKPHGWPAVAMWTESGFELFFLRNYSRIVTLLMRIVGDRARSEEIADDAFLKLYRQPLSADRKHNLEAWLYRTASRMGIDALRTASRRARVESAAASAGTPNTNAGSPLGSLLQSEKQLQVRKVLGRLRPAEAQMLILRSSGFSYKEIAAALGIRSGSVGTLLNRAEAAFEKAFNELFGAAGHGARTEDRQSE